MSDNLPAINEDAAENTEDFSLASELAKTAVISVVSTVGVLAGFALTGYAMDKFTKFRERRAEAKAAAIQDATAE
jgi:ABC-type glycerol-3-phosphate transport system permease component